MSNSFLQKLQRGFHYGERIHPVRDWLALLTVFFIVLAVSAVWNAWLFDQVASGGTLGAAATSTPEVFSKASLQNVEQIFADRALLDAKYTASSTTFTDPSI